MSGERTIVVGGGLAGLSAACELLERGCAVTILEKEANLGGNSSKATDGIAAPGCALQAAAGVKDDAANLAKDSPAAKALVSTGAKDVEWLTKLIGVDAELVLRATPGHGGVARTLGTKTHFPGAVVTYATIHILQQIAVARPDKLELVASATVTRLLTKGDKVVGVEYTAGGTTMTLNGSVVMAAGGFAGDMSPDSVLGKSAPALTKLPTTNDERSSGDAVTLCKAVGAAVEGLDKVELTPCAAVAANAPDSQFKLVVSDAICGAGGRLLDAQGKRFTDETASSQVRVEAMGKAKGPFRLVISEGQAASVQWLCDFYAERKVMKKYASASALAKDMKVASLDSSIGSGALYVATVTPALYSCAGGVVTGWEGGAAGRVLSSGKKPIEGLFAAGEATAAPFSKLWGISGIPLLYSVYSGRMAGRAAAGEGKTVTDLREVIISCLTTPGKLVEAAEKAAKPEQAAEPGTTEKPLEEMTQEELIAKVKDLQANGPPAAAAPAGPTGISMDEVKKHNTKEDAWIVINGEVVDVTTWIPIHPGGEQAIMAYLGQDASDEWNMIHKPGTMEKNYVQEGGKGPVKKGKLGGGAPPAAAGGGAVASAGGLTMDEVAKHNTESDVWIVLHGRAYDVTKWTQAHPGGVAPIMAFAGKDCTDEWVCIHKPGTVEKNSFPGNPNGAVDKGPVSGAVVSVAPAGAPVDDELPPPEGDGGIPGPIGAILFLVKNLIVMLLKTVFFTGNFKFSLDGDRKGTIRSACFLLTFTIVHVLGNFVGMVKGPLEANGEGYFFDRIGWTGGLGLVQDFPFSIVEEYLALGLLLHVTVALKRSWDISINYCLYTGRWNMLLSGLTILFFLTMHLADIRFSSEMKYTMLRPPKHFVAFSGLLEGRVFFETDESIPLVRVRDLYTREVELFKDLGTSMLYSACIVIFWLHMLIGWKKVVPADAMQIPKDHVKTVTLLGWIAATAIVSMYLSVVWYTYVMPPMQVVNVP